MGEVKALDRRAAVAALLVDRGDLLVVSGLGSPSYDVMAAGDHDRNYYLWGAMGSAAMVGFGLAAAQPRTPVLVLTGDGEMMMGAGALATIAVKKPPNLTIAVLDNGQFGETGMQASHTGLGLEIDRLAAGCGFPWTARIDDDKGLIDLRQRLRSTEGPRFATLKVRAGNAPRVLPPRDGVFVKNRLRAALGHSPI